MMKEPLDYQVRVLSFLIMQDQKASSYRFHILEKIQPVESHLQSVPALKAARGGKYVDQWLCLLVTLETCLEVDGLER